MTELAAIITAVAGLIAGVLGYMMKLHNSQIQDLRADKKESKKTQEKMLDIIQDTNDKVSKLEVEVAKLEPWTCYKKGCKLREENEGNTKKNSKKA